MSTDETTAVNAILWIYRLGDPEAIPALKRAALESSSAKVRAEAAMSVANYGEQRDLSFFREALQRDPNNWGAISGLAEKGNAADVEVAVSFIKDNPSKPINRRILLDLGLGGHRTAVIECSELLLDHCSTKRQFSTVQISIAEILTPEEEARLRKIWDIAPYDELEYPPMEKVKIFLNELSREKDLTKG